MLDRNKCGLVVHSKYNITEYKQYKIQGKLLRYVIKIDFKIALSTFKTKIPHNM